MSVRMRMTSTKTRSRRSHHKTDGPTLTVEAGVTRRRHFANPETGEYRGKQIRFKVANAGTSSKASKAKEADAPKVLEAPAEAVEKSDIKKEEAKS